MSFQGGRDTAIGRLDVRGAELVDMAVEARREAGKHAVRFQRTALTRRRPAPRQTDAYSRELKPASQHAVEAFSDGVRRWRHH
jgi:hypothetical protein